MAERTHSHDGVRISELERYDMSYLNAGDFLMIPISYNGFTQIVSVGDMVNLFANNGEGGKLWERITQGFQELESKVDTFIETQHEIDRAQNENIDWEGQRNDSQESDLSEIRRNLEQQTNINITQGEDIGENREYLDALAQALHDHENLEIWGVYSGEEENNH